MRNRFSSKLRSKALGLSCLSSIFLLNGCGDSSTYTPQVNNENQQVNQATSEQKKIPSHNAQSNIASSTINEEKTPKGVSSKVESVCDSFNVLLNKKSLTARETEQKWLKNQCSDYFEKIFQNDVNRTSFRIYIDTNGKTHKHDVDGFIYASYYQLPELQQWLMQQGYNVNASKPSISQLIESPLAATINDLVKHGLKIKDAVKSGSTLLELLAKSLYKWPENSALIKPIVETGAEVTGQGYGAFLSTLQKVDKKHGTDLLLSLKTLNLTESQKAIITPFISQWSAKQRKEQLKQIKKQELAAVKNKKKLFSGFVYNASKGDIEKVQQAIALGIDIQKPYYGTAALIAAAENNQTGLISYLVNAGADINGQSSWYNGYCANALFHAVVSGNLSSAKVLLERGATPNLMGFYKKNYYSPLALSQNKNDTALAELITAHGGKFLDSDDFKAFEKALNSKTFEQATALLTKGVNINQGHCSGNSRATTVIGHAIANLVNKNSPNPATIFELIEFGAQNNFTFSQYQHEVLRFAAKAGDKRSVNFLLANGGNVNAKPISYDLKAPKATDYLKEKYARFYGDKPEAILFSVINQGDASWLQSLIKEHNIELNTDNALTRELAITQAIRLAQFDIANVMLDSGKLLDRKRWWGRGNHNIAPLIRYQGQVYQEFIREHGLPTDKTITVSDCKIPTNSDTIDHLHNLHAKQQYQKLAKTTHIAGALRCSPLSWAVRYQQNELIEKLLEQGFSMFPVIHTDKPSLNYVGKSLIDYAVLVGNIDIVKRLHQAGGNITHSAVLAVAFNQPKILNYLLKNDALVNVRVPSINSRGGGIHAEPHVSTSGIKYIHVYDESNKEFNEDWMESLLTLAAYVPDNQAIIDILLAYNVTLSHKVQGKTALDIAIAKGNKNNIELLTAKGVSRG